MTGRPGLLARLADCIGATVERRPALVAIDGVDGAGKTIFSRDLATVLRSSGSDVVEVSIDGFHNPADVRYARAAVSPGISYYEDSFDYDAFRRLVIDPIREGGARAIIPQIFDHTSDSPTGRKPHRVGDDAIVLVDGIFLGRPEIAPAWDCWIYLHVEKEVARARGVARDEALYGAATLDRYLTRYEPGQELYHSVADPVANADVVIDNTAPEAPEFCSTLRVDPD